MNDAMPKFGDLVAGAPEKKRMGRPPGKKNAADVPKKTKRKYKKRVAKTVPAPEREFACFLDEEGGVQLCRNDGQGDVINLTKADVLAIGAFVELYRVVLAA